MKNSIHEEQLSVSLQSNNQQFKIAVTSLTGYNGIFKVTDKNNNFFSAKSINEKYGSIQILIPQGAYELESINDETKRITFDEGQFTEVDYPFKIKPNFSTIVSIINISRQKPLISCFLSDDSIQNFLGFNASIIYQ